MRYAQYLSEAFRERLSVLERNAIGALSLRDELLIMHDICGRAAASYEAALAQSAKTENLEQRMRLVHFATEYLVAALNEVRDMTVAAKRVEESGRVVDVSVVHALVAQTCQILDDKIRANEHTLMMVGGSPDEFVMDVAHDIRTKLLTVDAVAKTQLTPERLDKQVLVMHGSVPEVA